VETKARGDEAVTFAVETSHHDGKLVGMVDPSKGNMLDMTTVRTTSVTNIKITLHATAMAKGKALAAMTRTRKIQLHVEQREAIIVAEIHRRMSTA
jgi:hypothetical protein